MNTIEESLAEIAAGRMVVMMDDEDRENEGDLLIAASCVRAEDINFMARHGRGLICLTLTEERCRRLRLPLMVREAEDRHGTNFTVSIEAAQGVTTGISAHDRARTVRAAVATEARPDVVLLDIGLPGMDAPRSRSSPRSGRRPPGGPRAPSSRAAPRASASRSCRTSAAC